MNKTFLNTLIKNMQKAGIVTKASDWFIEGHNEKQLFIKYVGIKPSDDWQDIISPNNNLMLKIILDKDTAYSEFYLANKPPFIKLSGAKLTQSSKWETLLGELKRRLRKDKEEYQHHTQQAGNIYELIKQSLK